MLTIAELLKNATEILQSNSINEPRKEAGSLMEFALKKDKTFLIAHSEYELNVEEQKAYQTVVERRANREPFQYIVGKQEFYGLDFIVTPDVLIPRPETELIVESALEILKNIENPRFCEVGTGSGCISISILYENKTAIATGLDISESALKITHRNAENHDVIDRLKLEISDIFENLSNEKFDLIVSNPPYIPSGDMANLQKEVRDFEPSGALTDGKDGYSIIEKIISDAPNFLKPKGFLLMEIGYNQSQEVRTMFSEKIWRKIEFSLDLQGIERMVNAELI